MSGLFGSLSMAARALDAQRYGLDVAGQNIANVNTPGYSRRTALLAAVPGPTQDSPGRGVEVAGLLASRDSRLERRLHQERPAEQRAAALQEVLAMVETAVGRPGESVDRAISDFFDSLGRLSDDPTSAVARQEVVSRGDALARAFGDMTGRLEQARRDADFGVRGTVDRINALIGRVASLNASIGGVPPDSGQALHLRDELGVVLDELSTLADVDVLPRENGGVDVLFGSGRPLVVGPNAYTLDVVSTPPAGMAAIVAQDWDVTSEIVGGRLGGLLHARDVQIPAYLERLDALAYGVVTEVNAIHRTGYDLNGTTNRDFFVTLGGPAGAAAAIAVDPAVLADPSFVAAAGTTSQGDNTVARSLAALRDARVLDGGTATFAEGWGQLVYRVGSDSRAARDEQSSRAEIVRQVELLREQVSGVSLDEEAMMMMKFQRAYEANARYFQTVDSALEVLLQMVGR